MSRSVYVLLADARVLGAAFAEPKVATLARRADAEVFGPAEPTPADVEEFWRQIDESVGGMGRGRSPWGRITARLSLRSLLAGTRFALPERKIRRAAPSGRAQQRPAPPPASPSPEETA